MLLFDDYKIKSAKRLNFLFGFLIDPKPKFKTIFIFSVLQILKYVFEKGEVIKVSFSSGRSQCSDTSLTLN